MWDIIKNVFSAISIFPFLPFVIVYFGYMLFDKDKKKAIRMAMDVSTIFFVIHDAALLNNLFNSSFALYGMLLVMIIGAGLLGNGAYRKSQNIPWKRIIRAIWRVTFFVTALLYIFLSMYVLLKLAFTV